MKVFDKEENTGVKESNKYNPIVLTGVVIVVLIIIVNIIANPEESLDIVTRMLWF